MQRRFYSIALLLLCMLAGTTVLHAQTPSEFNNRLAAITDSISVKGQDWAKRFSEANTTRDYTKLTASRARLERFIDQKMAEVEAMKDVNDSKALRSAMLDFLVFERGMINSAFKPFEAFGKNAPEDKLKAALMNLNVYGKEEKVSLGMVAQAQHAYAQANGFKID